MPTILLLEKYGKLSKGASWGVYVTMYAFIRFLMELLSRNAWVSLAAMAFGVLWIVYTQRRAERRTLVGKPTFFSPQPATVEVAEEGAPVQGTGDAGASGPEVAGDSSG